MASVRIVDYPKPRSRWNQYEEKFITPPSTGISATMIASKPEHEFEFDTVIGVQNFEGRFIEGLKMLKATMDDAKNAGPKSLEL